MHTQNIERSLAAGAFGVPTFVTDAGEVFLVKTGCPFSAITYGGGGLTARDRFEKRTAIDRPTSVQPADVSLLAV